MSRIIVEIEEFTLREVHIHGALLQFVVSVSRKVRIVRHIGMIHIITVILSVDIGIVISFLVMAATFRQFEAVNIIFMHVLWLLRV